MSAIKPFIKELFGDARITAANIPDLQLRDCAMYGDAVHIYRAFLTDPEMEDCTLERRARLAWAAAIQFQTTTNELQSECDEAIQELRASRAAEPHTPRFTC